MGNRLEGLIRNVEAEEEFINSLKLSVNHIYPALTL
jgi:hypothetical protein